MLARAILTASLLLTAKLGVQFNIYLRSDNRTSSVNFNISSLPLIEMLLVELVLLSDVSID